MQPAGRLAILTGIVFLAALCGGCAAPTAPDYNPIYSGACSITATNTNENGESLFLEIEGTFDGVVHQRESSSWFAPGETEIIQLDFDPKMQYHISTNAGGHGVVVYDGLLEDGFSYVWDVYSEFRVILMD